MKPRTLMMRIAIVLAVAVAMSVTATAQKGKPASGPTPIRVDGKLIKSYIEWLAAPEREGRRTLTPGYEQSVEWAVGKFKEWGVKPAGENGTYIQNVPITSRGGAPYARTTGIPELVVDGRAFLARDNDFTLDTASTPGATASGEIVFVGYGISAPAKGLDEYAGVDVKGRVVLAFKGSPKDAPAAAGRFGPPPPTAASIEAWADESTDAAKIKTAYDKGAAAILLFNTDTLAPQAGGRGAAAVAAPVVQMGPRPAPLDPAAFTRPFLAVTDIDVRVFRQVMYRDPLALQESPRAFIARIDQVRRDIRDRKPRSMATGVRAQIKGYATATFYGEKYNNNISHNVIGKVEGTDPKLKNQYIVIGGHMDHLGVTSGIVFPGADDDASGAATVMEMARVFAANAATIKPKRTIVFALWCGEEQGLVGSNYWGGHPTDGVTMDNVVANFNNDMVGLGEGIGAPGALNFPTIFEVVMKNQDPDVAKAVHPSTAGPGGSDYSTFIEKGIESFALMTDGGIGHPDYHDSGDKSGKIDPEILRKNGQFVLQGAINVANETSVNLIIPDRLHLYNGMRLTLLNLNEIGGGRGGGRGGQAAAPRGPRLNVALSEPSAFGGNVTMIEVAAKLLGVGRVDVPARGDGVWFSAAGVTEAGQAALRAFETNGVVLNLVNPGRTLLLSMLDSAKKPFIVSGLTTMPDAELAQRIKAKNVLVAVDFDVAAPQAVAAKLMDFKKAAGNSGNLLLVTRAAASAGGRGEAAPAEPRMSQLEQAKQQMYLALIKAGWTKDEINSMVGVNPPPPPGTPGGGRGGGGGLGGNLAKLSAAVGTT
jgi:hypothetical protein